MYIYFNIRKKKQSAVFFECFKMFSKLLRNGPP